MTSILKSSVLVKGCFHRTSSVYAKIVIIMNIVRRTPRSSNSVVSKTRHVFK